MAIPAWAVAAGLQTAGGIVTNAFNVREAGKNRAWQERMSNTAHQREVADLKAAGLNPMIRNINGATTPSGDRAEINDPSAGVAGTALQTKLLAAQLKKLEAETHFIEDQALKTRAEVGRYEEESNAGRYERLVAERELANLTTEEKRQMVPIALDRARAEIEATLSSARAARAVAALNEAARTGALNMEEFEKHIGEAGPWTKYFINILRTIFSPARLTPYER